MNEKELTNQVYDTLFQNVGVSEDHVAFDMSKVTNQYVAGNSIYIEFENCAFDIKITKTHLFNPA